jgi:uncharacterized protein YndB with AHSA1/START domain
MSSTERLSASRKIPAPAADIFKIVSDPHGHVRIDGSGMLITPQGTAPITAVGDSFTMDMDGPTRGFPDLGTYQVVNTITRYEDDSVVEWTVGLPDQDPIGHVYGFTLTAISDGETEVTHYYDWSGAGADWKARMDFPVISAEGLGKTLQKLESVAS